MDDLKETLRGMVAHIIEMDPKDIGDDALFIKDLGMDSMMALEILASIEKKYRIEIPEAMLPKFTSINETVKQVSGIINQNSGETIS
ncbi:MAG: acyl carrier protein [Candidatus Omnitrophica bacterium]|nr:acyl carrier protein [Candidatus Omnitrophota bacterium]